MGRASRSKQQRGPRRSRADLLGSLAENQQFLTLSAQAYDSGLEAEAKRLAVVLRVLLHDTNLSHSVLGQLNVKDALAFLDSAEPINPKNLLSTPGLVIMRTEFTPDNAQGRYMAPLGMERPSGVRLVPFAGWWQDPVMKVDGTWSRKQLVLALANQEGGANVDPSLDERYESLAKRNGLGWTAVSGGTASPFSGDVIAAAVRQIAYEVSETLVRERTRLQ